MFAIKNSVLERDGAAVEQMPSPYKGGAFAKPPKIVVMHFTGGGSARSSAEWFRSPQNPGSSAHVVIDRDGSVVQCVPFNRVAWHAGKSQWHGLIGLNQYATNRLICSCSGTKILIKTAVGVQTCHVFAHHAQNVGKPAADKNLAVRLQ